MSVTPRTDIGAQVVAVQANAQATAAGAAIALVAGATEDGVKVTGTSINRRDSLSCVLSIMGLASLADTETLSLAVEYQQSADGSTWDTAVAMQASTVAATGSTGGTNETFAVELPLLLKGKKKYIRFNVTPAMSAATTDIAVWSASAILAGYDVLPATQATS